MKIASINFFTLHGKLAPIFRDYERVSRPLDFYEEFDNQGPGELIDKNSGMISVKNTFLEIKTDEGISGIHGPLVYDNLVHHIRGMAGFLIGRDPMSTEVLWDQMRKLDRHSRAGFSMMALSAVDCALWDIKGKALKQPIYKLLGGSSRKKVQAYVSTLGCSLEIQKAIEKAKELKGLGYTAQKWFFRYGPNAGKEGMLKNLKLAEALREAVGDNHSLRFDCWMGWDLDYSIKMFKQLEGIEPDWIEEPLMPNDLEGYKRLACETSIPIATGEHLYTRWEFKPFLDSGSINTIQPDPAWTGGITELKKLGDLAEIYSVKMIPHGCIVPAAVQVIAALPPSVSPCAEYLVSYQERQQLFYTNPYKPVDGYIELSQEPGLGVSFDENKIERKEYI
jgi:L-rhamnonate dehydratase